VGNFALPSFGKAIFVGTGHLLKTARDMTKQGEALQKLFSRLAAFLSRLEVRGRAKIQPNSRRIIVNILIELLNSLGIATVILKGKIGTRVKTYVWKLLFHEDEIEKALQRLSELTEEESAMVLAELATSRADFEDLIKQVGGLDVSVRRLASQIRSVIGIGKLGHEELRDLSSLLQSTRTDDTEEVLRVLRVLKIKDDGTQKTLNRIETEIKAFTRGLASRNEAVGQSSSNGETNHEAGDVYGTYDNHGQHVTGGTVDIRVPETPVAPVRLDGPQPRPLIPTPAGNGDTYGNYSNYGQHITGGKVSIEGSRAKSRS